MSEWGGTDMQGDDYFHSQGRTSQAKRKAEGACMDGTVWCMEGWDGGRGCMHGCYSMVHGRIGGEGACMDGTVWCMEGCGDRGCMHGWYSMVHRRMRERMHAWILQWVWCMEG